MEPTCTEEELIESLLWMVRQHCGRSRGKDYYDSQFISAEAAAIRTLISLGVLEMVEETPTRWVVAKETERSRQIL